MHRILRTISKVTSRSAHFTGVLSIAIAIAAFGILPIARAQNVDDLKEKIHDFSQKILELNREIGRYNQQLEAIGAEKQTLQSAIKTLDISRKKISTDIQVTENRIASTDLEIIQLEQLIEIKELEIERDTIAVGEMIRSVDELERESLLEVLLKHESLSDFWGELEELTTFRETMRTQLVALAAAKEEYEDTRDEARIKRGELSGLHTELNGEKVALDQNREEKEELLEVTQNKESEYQRLRQEKIAAREQFERELRQYESQLQYALDRSTIPAVGSGVLAWPFDGAYFAGCASFAGALGNPHCITQYFGNTPFAKSGAYNGSGHNGIDFRAPNGTKITAALSGVVEATGNTDQYAGCYSYGKWVLVRHANGITSLYAHLSAISVSPGQQVSTGSLIGYSGSTGYVTGPHLHFSVYASDGVKVQRLGDIPGRPITGCSPASIPVAAFEAYLNPLDYL